VHVVSGINYNLLAHYRQRCMLYQVSTITYSPIIDKGACCIRYQL